MTKNSNQRGPALIFWRGAWHIRLGEAQIHTRKEHRDSVLDKSVPKAGSGKHAQAGNWQLFPEREVAKPPRQELQNVPRQGTGKSSQAGNWQVSQAGTQNAQAGQAHWQAFPRRELASVPDRDCKCAPRRALSNVSRQRTVHVPRQGTVGIANEHCTNELSNNLPPSPKVPLHRQPAVCCVMRLHACLRDEKL